MNVWINRIACCLLCLASVYFSITSVVAISARTELTTAVTQGLQSANAAIASLSPKILELQREYSGSDPQRGDVDGHTSPTGVQIKTLDAFDQRDLILRKIGYEKTLILIDLIHINGENNKRSLYCLLDYLARLNNFSEPYDNVYTFGVCEKSEKGNIATETFGQKIGYWMTYLIRMPSKSTSLLLALAVIFSAGFGALIADIMRRDLLTVRRYFIGVSAGFFAYFAVRGGSFLLVLPNQVGQGGYVDLNPYGLALVGALVGLFSDRMYEFIRRRVMEAAGLDRE